MIYVVVNDKKCVGYTTSPEKALEEVKKDIYTRYNVDDLIIETNHNETKIDVYKKYINMNTFPNDVKCLETCYTIYKADFIS
jgi:hypothetical protein